MKPNPFKPTAGAEPPILAGRDDVLRDFELGLEEGVGAPGRLMRITGPRGSGKTVLLTELGDIARQHGWHVVDVTASASLLKDLGAVLAGDGKLNASLELNMGVARASFQKHGIGGPEAIRDALGRVARGLTKQGKGLLVTVDEIQDASVQDVREIAVAVQHLIRERQNIAFVFAGLTSGVMDLLGEDGPTFLRRAYPEELDTIPVEEVSCALQKTIEKNGMTIGRDSLRAAAEATAGYAYLIQLVGYSIWRAAQLRGGTLNEITLEDVEGGIEVARREFGRTVLETAIARLPKTAMDYMLAMTEDKRVSSTGEIAARLGVSAASLTSARKLLISRQVVEPTARGYIQFSIPFMREYLVEHRKELLARYGVEE